MTMLNRLENMSNVRAAVYCPLSKDGDLQEAKDLSRLGRNYLQTGYLIEDFFSCNGGR